MDETLTGMIEPIITVCGRCNARVVITDLRRCGRHETEPFCSICYQDHVARTWQSRRVIAGGDAPQYDCWPEQPLGVQWV